jgi:hypothetical protein
MKVYALVLTCGDEGRNSTSIIAAYISKDAAEERKLSELVRLEEVVRLHIQSCKLMDDWVDENPYTFGSIDCKCTDTTCDTCKGWGVLYDVVKAATHKDIGYQHPMPRYADEGFTIDVVETELI